MGSFNRGCLDGGRYVDEIVDEYAKEVGRNVVNSMRGELKRISEWFLQLFASDNDEGDCVKKCYGKDIASAIVYYRQFTTFLAVAAGLSGNDAGIDADDKLRTLFRFVAAINGEEGFASPLSRFTTCPSTRANLVSDIQQLEAFLSSRKCELSSKSISALCGRDVVGS